MGWEKVGNIKGVSGKDADPIFIKSEVIQSLGQQCFSREDVSALVAVEIEKAQSGIEAIVKERVEAAIQSITLKAGADGRDGVDGKSVSVGDVAPLILAEVKKAVYALPPAKDGDSVEPADIEAMVSKAVALIPKPKDGPDGTSVSLEQVATLAAVEVKKAVDAIPRPQDGRSVDLAEVDTLVASHVQKAVAGLPVPKDGASVTAADVAPLIAQEVQKAVAAIPRAQDGAPGQVGPVGPSGADGKSLSVDDIAPMLAAEVHKAVSAIPVPKDGVGALGALLDRAGHLVLTLSDGTVKDLGGVVGRDVDMAEVKSLIMEDLAKWARPKDGKDGLGFDDLSVLHDGERGFTFQFTRGEQVKSFQFTIPCVIYRELWTEGKAYEQGDAVTYGGSMWVAKEPTTTKPDATPFAAKSWKLAIKEGRRGRDADPALIETMVNKAVAKLPKPKDPQR